jgi:hypothetical protein
MAPARAAAQAADVHFGSKAGIGIRPINVCFAFESGHRKPHISASTKQLRQLGDFAANRRAAGQSLAGRINRFPCDKPREQTTAHKRLFADEGPPSGAFWLLQCCKQPSFFKNKSSSAGIPPRALTTKATMTFG